MKKFILVSLCSLILLSVSAQKVIQLYDGPAPGSESWTWNEAENNHNKWKTRVVYNVSKPTLTVFTPDLKDANGTSVIICPGGGFNFLAIDKEGYDVAKWLVKKGVTCFILKYRLKHFFTNDIEVEIKTINFRKNSNRVNIIEMSVADGKAAITYVRNHAKEYNIASDKIGIMGFSAGGTVTVSSLFNYTKESRPDFAAPIYPFVPPALLDSVPYDAPPIFIVAASDDRLTPNSVNLYSKWLSTKHDAEIHIYARGGHGFGMDVQNLPTDTWIERFSEWLDIQGFLNNKKTPLKSIGSKK